MAGRAISNVIGKKNNQSLVSNAGREIPTLGSTDKAEISVNLVSGIIRLRLGVLGLHRRPLIDSIVSFTCCTVL